MTDIEKFLKSKGKTETVRTKDQEEIPVKSPVGISGVSSNTDICTHIFIFIRDVSKSAQPWRVIHNTQVNTNSRWSGIADLDAVSVGSKIEIEARATMRGQDYKINAKLLTAPTLGVRSNPITVRRVK